jgi:hypothetical protein
MMTVQFAGCSTPTLKKLAIKMIVFTFNEILGKQVQLLAENRSKVLADQITDGLLGAVVAVDGDIKL